MVGNRQDGGEPAGAGRPVVLLAQPFTAETVTVVRHALAARVAAAGLPATLAEDFVLAAHELVTNAVRHGGGAGHLRLARQDDVLTCEVSDHGRGADGLSVELPEANVPGGRGLWLAQQLTGGLMLNRRTDGVTASVSVRLTPPTGPRPTGPTPTGPTPTGPTPTGPTPTGQVGAVQTGDRLDESASEGERP